MHDDLHRFPFYIGGVRIDPITLADTILTIDSWIKGKNKAYIVLTGAHGVMEMQQDEHLRQINNAADLVTPDGMSVVWVGKSRGYTAIEKVCASNIMMSTFAESVTRGYRHYFYGGDEGVADLLAYKLMQKYPGFEVAGTFCPPFRQLTEAEISDIANAINRANPDIVWCSLGCPKQEKWMARFRPLLDAPVLIGVGAGFDFLTGRKPIAPHWVHKSGFEWLFRLLSEPRRLWPRYSRVVPGFIFLVLAELLNFKHKRDSRS
jgi:N-acetylglucosaminyldiphosphoundecaprenol N-acetyl-beta-D-mannosaminyltransferase